MNKILQHPIVLLVGFASSIIGIIAFFGHSTIFSFWEKPKPPAIQASSKTEKLLHPIDNLDPAVAKLWMSKVAQGDSTSIVYAFDFEGNGKGVYLITYYSNEKQICSIKCPFYWKTIIKSNIDKSLEINMGNAYSPYIMPELRDLKDLNSTIDEFIKGISFENIKLEYFIVDNKIHFKNLISKPHFYFKDGSYSKVE